MFSEKVLEVLNKYLLKGLVIMIQLSPNLVIHVGLIKHMVKIEDKPCGAYRSKILSCILLFISLPYIVSCIKARFIYYTSKLILVTFLTNFK